MIVKTGHDSLTSKAADNKFNACTASSHSINWELSCELLNLSQVEPWVIKSILSTAMDI